jgi:hypothetical protein
MVRAMGLTVRDYQNVILVNQVGLRFYDETAGQYPSNVYNTVKTYKQGSYSNAAGIKYNPASFLDAALAGTGDPVNGGGPIWAIFDADAVKREQWTVEAPYVDTAAQADARVNPRRNRDPLQFICRRWERPGFREALAKV